jgi:hypothetical protein
MDDGGGAADWRLIAGILLTIATHASRLTYHG